MHVMAFFSHADTHGVVLISGLHGEQAYFIFFLCSSVTADTSLSSRSIITVTNSKTFWGQNSTHLPQPSHFSESIMI